MRMIRLPTASRGFVPCAPWLLAVAVACGENDRTEATVETAAPVAAVSVSPPPLVDVAWLAARREDPGLLILDPRSTAEYATGHLPGAISLPYRETYGASDPSSTDLAPVGEINRLLSTRGVAMDRTVVIAGDDHDYRPAAWLFWVLEVHGHPAACVLNGGLAAWRAAGLPLVKEPVTPLPATFVAEFDPRRFADKVQVHRAMRDASAVLLDARPLPEYTGEQVGDEAARPGHIPTSIHLPATALHSGDDGDSAACSMLDPNALRDGFANFMGHKVLAYCNTGRSAAVSYLALRSLGIDAAVYDGAWTEWSADATLPAQVGIDPGVPQ
jgi:thiosulfate/3-mercaptopyruvate sulfurtransferase